MQAFPEGSANNALGGSGPVNSSLNLAQFHGRGEEGFEDFSTSRKAEPTFDPYGADGRVRPVAPRSTSFNPRAATEPVHGDESMGLGTSTFLDGAPASRMAIQRRQSESEPLNSGMAGGGGGLARKKSLAQKIRGISNSRGGGAGRLNSPEPRYGVSSPGSTAQSAGGLQKTNENNPFFNDYDDAYEKKGQRIQIAEDTNGAGRARAPSSPRRGLGLQRSVTADSAGVSAGETNGVGGGFLNRMKSLKGGRRARPERKE